MNGNWFTWSGRKFSEQKFFESFDDYNPDVLLFSGEYCDVVETFELEDDDLANDLEELMLHWFNIKLTQAERKVLEQEILQLCDALGL